MFRSHQTIGAFPNLRPKPKRQWRTRILVLRRFQYRYAFFLASAGLVVSLAVGLISIFFLSRNFELLVKMELLTAPRIVDNLYREFKLTYLIISSVLFGFVVFLALIGLKFSNRIVVPIYLIQEKMKEICRGNLNNVKIQLRKTDEFQEFSETYNYLVDSLQTQLKMDLDRIKKLKPDSHNRDATHIWQKLLDEKMAQLTGVSSEADPSDVSHRAS